MLLSSKKAFSILLCQLELINYQHRVISEVDNPSNEWLLLQKFNNPDLRSDPRNRTIHVIEYITFANFVFAVMPRCVRYFLHHTSSLMLQFGVDGTRPLFRLSLQLQSSWTLPNRIWR